MSKNLFIPPLGTEVQLAEPWTFELFCEMRNWDLFTHLDVPDNEVHRYRHIGLMVTLPENTILKIDRIYIRKGQSNFDSVTFSMTHHGDKKLKKRVRFWAKLHDANTIILKD